MTNDLDVINEADPEYEALVARLDREFPQVGSQGFDFSKIQGHAKGRTAKAIVLHLSLTGWSVHQIAESLASTPPVVGRYLADALCEAIPIEDVEVIRRHELLKLDMEERLCHEQFARSCEDATTDVTTWEEEDEKGRKIPSAEGYGVAVIKRTRKHQSGNPGYMRVLQEIAKRRAALIGLDKPRRVEVDKTDRKLIVNVVEVRNRDDVEAARNAGLLKGPERDGG